MLGHRFLVALTISAAFLCLPSDAQQCYRCFGANWCNNFNDPEFQTNVLIADCPATLNSKDHYYGDNPLIARLLDKLDRASSARANLLDDEETTWGCVTASIHEDHEVHTVRTCLNNARTICPVVQSVILNPDANDVSSDIVLDCEGCIGSLCNDHTFIENNQSTIQTTTPTTETTITTSAPTTETTITTSAPTTETTLTTPAPTTGTTLTTLAPTTITYPTTETTPSLPTLPTTASTEAPPSEPTTTAPEETTTTGSSNSLLVSYVVLGLVVLVDFAVHWCDEK